MTSRSVNSIHGWVWGLNPSGPRCGLPVASSRRPVAGDPAGVVGDEERDGVGHVLGLAERLRVSLFDRGHRTVALTAAAVTRRGGS